ncbi:polysaccharide pyruvyl transferase family protein [Clostridium celatum]|uniref:Polysaccharide pyruvyl transferase n=1 Tax=Clostridium celatum DSM 1785 TaxID=545697 RepID=L1QM42_9CLOT|nr:polysaccharide pyruvyl transferase family protein [Clostridium celatum]EKY29059.1 polysaccharide pyruvyl transferase [Clostridium celatum DSM 1785]MCE9654383.1 polysaccharide pyruvyl transferase family protein [Clostridium celatum]
MPMLSKNIIVNLCGEKFINRIKYTFSFIYYKKFKKYKNEKKIIHAITPVYGNMGDQAIIYATNKLLRKYFSEYKLIEVNSNEFYKYAKALKYEINDDDLIVLIGGGNMGNIWVSEEVGRRLVIKTFHNNKIISMPQTIDFTKDKNGIHELKKSKRIYNNHKNLTLIAREENSYKIMKKEFNNCRVLINPDIVLSLYNNIKFNDYERTKVMLCLRNDKESIIDVDKSRLFNELDRAFENVFAYDTVINISITADNRENELRKMLNEFLRCKVVITDRLHGMLFAAITKTPCIVTKSLDYKITGTYEWIKDLNYIKFVEKLDTNLIKQLGMELINLNEKTNIDFESIYFKKLINSLS